MEHVAIMRKSWGLTQKILSGKKKIESRWYKVKYAPWDRIKFGEIVYFKDSGEPVTIKTEVEKVIQFSDLTPIGVVYNKVPNFTDSTFKCCWHNTLLNHFEAVPFRRVV